MAGRSLAPVRVLLAARQHATFGAFEMLEMKLVQPTGLYELLLIGQSDTNQPATGYSNVELLPPLVRASIAAQTRGFHSSRALASRAFQPTSPCLFPASTKSKDAAAAPPKAPAPAPKAEDCDDAIREYDDLSHRLNQLERPSTMKSAGEQVKSVVVSVGNGLAAVGRFTLSVPGRLQAWASLSREERAARRAALWKNIKHEAHHYWVGGKLLAYEVRIASGYALKAARGETLTRRERRQLTRTTADLFRLVPLIIILVVPFLEFALPVLLRLFPNMLPSTFEDKLKKEEEMKRRLAIRLELAKFLQDTVSEMAKDLHRTGRGSDQAVTATELYDFIQKIRAGAAVENAEIIRFAQLFNDALTLDNLERVQLVSMAQFVGISPFGTDAYLRNRLRQHLQQIKHDDFEIEAEGLENLTEDELRQACRARGMRAPFGEGAVAFMRRQMHDWLDLSLHRGLPSSLLLLSRAFTITASVKDVAAKKDLAYEKLKETLSVIPEEVVERVEFETLGGGAGAGGQDGAKAMEKKLEYLKREEEIIKEEEEEALAYEKLKETLSVIPEEVVERVEFETLGGGAGAGGQDGAKAMEKKLEYLKREEEIIKEEAAAAKAAAAKAAAEAAAAAAAAPAPPAMSAAAAVDATAAAAAAAAGARAAAAAAPGSEAAAAAAAKAAAAAATAAALQPEVEAALTVEALSDEEKAAKEAAAREARVSATLEALLSLASSSAVARERQVFMDLVRKEVQRLNVSLVEKSGGGAAMAFSNTGLTTSAAGAAAAADAAGGAADAVGARVAKMLKNIEQELDKVESKIGDRLQLLDTDRDGVVSRQELQAAVSFLRTQMSPADLELLFEKLGVAASEPSKPIKIDELAALAHEGREASKVLEEQGHQPNAPVAASPPSPSSKAATAAAAAKKEAEADPVTKESVKIHTM
ncbi:hypothetical protein CHLRE_15g639150v5 [Chlamydomonas reinhardtii]|uniref:Mitochondrial proton/calcium exchanger protein n=1 Tax=Chlamydomonas reinhardtii TaxID=3055 RepID=A0A2K3CWR6_CHLRE|nr:uncharacterized protein CHLRE_15g639150v5 [Chlamydomonas reinhardtii]PNW72719.1 hypothetical protein CHLRE_15g639150v5 [Chlamydomonas reinhardtii]